MIHFVDHLFMFILFVVQPIHGFREFNRYVARVQEGKAEDRVNLYRQTLQIEWVAFGVLALTWVLLDRPFADLGIAAAGGTGFWIGAALIAVASVFLVYTWQRIKQMSSAEKEKQKKSLGPLVYMLPRNRDEYRAFFWLSGTAGIVEETIYRGFALWYLHQFMPMWAAIIVSSVMFGLGHSYQGPSGIVRITLVGILFGVLYVASGSIWLPILGHFLLDALQGASIVEILRNDDASTTTKSEPPTP